MKIVQGPLTLSLGLGEHNDCTRNRPNTLSSFIPSSPVQSLNGTCSLPLFLQPLHSSPSRVDWAAVSTTCSWSHLSMNIKILYIVLTTSAPVFYCFNNSQGTNRDHLLTHIAAGLATLCKSPVLDRKKKKNKRWEHEFMSSRDVEIFARNARVERIDPNVEARNELLFPSRLQTTFLSYITTLQRQQTNQTAITGRASTAMHFSAFFPLPHSRGCTVTSYLMFT